MTTQNENIITLQKPSLLKTIWNWLIAFDQTMSYRPQEYSYAKQDYLINEVAKLKSKIKHLEAPHKVGIK